MEPSDGEHVMMVGHPVPGGGFLCMCCNNCLFTCNCEPSEEFHPPECLIVLDGKEVDLDNGPDGEVCLHYIPLQAVPLPWKKLALRERRPCEYDSFSTLTFDIAKTFANKLALGENPFGGPEKCDQMAEWILNTICDCGKTRVIEYYCDLHKGILDEVP